MNPPQSPPAEPYALVEQHPASVLLQFGHSATSGVPSPARLFTNPLQILTAHSPAQLFHLFAEIELAVAGGLHAAGYFAYQCGQVFEPTAAPAQIYPSVEPLAWFGIYSEPQLLQLPIPVPHPIEVTSTIALTEPEYAARVAQIHTLIGAGDIYQLNFTLPIAVKTSAPPAQLYQTFRHRQPAPYSAFLHTQPGQHILSLSPELFFHLENLQQSRRITTRPMKGTAPRGHTPGEDLTQSRALANDPKNRAENVMIVDLLRNDLGRICQYGSVRASNLFAIERYPTLWQMTSTVTGQLRPQVDFQSIFRALFPCGSVTGAPKVRAMQLISQLESSSRGVYTGAIGFFSKTESVFNVAIRTLTLQGDSGVMGVGSGIVIDSVPAEEWRECQLKAKFLTQSAVHPGDFCLVETLIWDGRYPLLEQHMDRLATSAAWFGFPFHAAAARSALQSHISGSGSSGPLKVRLLLHSDGQLSVTSEPIPVPAPQPVRVRISRQRTDPADPFYFHKTTHRPLYLAELQSAQTAGYDEVLFLNTRGELTEAANHNLFLEKSGQLLTPPIQSGVLPGIQRAQILATHPNAAEQILTLEDLRQADAVYLSNAVRGLRKALIDWNS